MMKHAGGRAECPAVWTIPGEMVRKPVFRDFTALQKFLSHRVIPKK